MSKVPSALDASNFDAYFDHLQSLLPPPTRLASSLPSPRTELQFERSLDRTFANKLDGVGDELLELVNKVLGSAASGKRREGGGARTLKDEDDVVDRFQDLVVEVVDGLLERADICLDTHKTQLNSTSSIPQAASQTTSAPSIPRFNALNPLSQPAPSQPSSVSKPTAARLPGHILNSAFLPKPQLLFPESMKFDNSRKSEWISPAVLELKGDGSDADAAGRRKRRRVHWRLGKEDVERSEEERLKILTRSEEVEGDDDRGEESSRSLINPYKRLITDCPIPPEAFSLPLVSPPKPPPLEESFSKTPFLYVDTEEGFDAMMDEFWEDDGEAGGKSKVKELAVDLEHHDLRSWAGILSLMQISTRTKDYVVDLLKPEVRERVPELNFVLSDPDVVKVFHGADSDVQWLQRDFGIYVVNLFDTYHATKVLGFQQHSLASLLLKYCDFVADKRYQRADWRIRPLPAEMLNYARSDTHFLLYVYDQLRTSLLSDTTASPSQLELVFDRSRSVSLRTFKKEKYDYENGRGYNGWRNILRKWGKDREWGVGDFEGVNLPSSSPAGDGSSGSNWENLVKSNLLSFHIFRAVHSYRDNLARSLDESVHYILPNHQLLSISMSHTPPRDPAAVISSLNGGGGRGSQVPNVMFTKAGEIAKVISEAVDEWEDGGWESWVRRFRDKGRKGREEVLGVAGDGLGVPTLSEGERWQPKVAQDPGLWKVADRVGPKGLVASSSGLFGRSSNKIMPGKEPTTLRAANSVFLDGVFASSLGAKKNPSFLEVAERIHREFALGVFTSTSKASTSRSAPSTPADAVGTDANLDYIAMDEDKRDDAVSTNPYDHPFVPRSKRGATELKASSSSHVNPQQSSSATMTAGPSSSIGKEKAKKEEDDVIVVSSLPGSHSGSGLGPANGKKKRKRKEREKESIANDSDVPGADAQEGAKDGGDPPTKKSKKKKQKEQVGAGNQAPEAGPSKTLSEGPKKSILDMDSDDESDEKIQAALTGSARGKADAKAEGKGKFKGKKDSEGKGGKGFGRPVRPMNLGGGNMSTVFR